MPLRIQPSMREPLSYEMGARIERLRPPPALWIPPPSHPHSAKQPPAPTDPARPTPVPLCEGAGASARVSGWGLLVTIDDYPTRVCAGQQSGGRECAIDGAGACRDVTRLGACFKLERSLLWLAFIMRRSRLCADGSEKHPNRHYTDLHAKVTHG